MKDWEDYKGKHCSKWIQLCEKIQSEVDAEELAKAEQFAVDLIPGSVGVEVMED